MSDALERSIHVQVVDDNPADARLVAEALAEDTATSAFRVSVSTSLSASLAAAERETPDIVLLDLGLPDSQGLETFRTLQSALIDVPIVVLSGHPDDEAVAVAAVQEGAEDVLLKGEVTPRLLGRSIRYAVERHDLQERLQYLATHDPLTGVYNRHYFNQTIEGELARSARYDHPIGFLMVDINRFKEINDRHGHQVGDLVLQRVAAYLKERLRSVDLVIRYGGDEFLLVLPETNGAAKEVAHRIQQQAFAQLAGIHPDLDIPITLAVGASHWNPGDGLSIENPLVEADQRMYEHKRAMEGG